MERGFLVLQKDEKNKRIQVATKNRVYWLPLKTQDPRIVPGQWIDMSNDAVEILKGYPKTFTRGSNVSVKALIIGAHDEHDPDNKGCLISNYFTTIHPGVINPRLNLNEVKNLVVEAQYDHTAGHWVAIRVIRRDEAPLVCGVVYAFESHAIARLHAPGWPLDFMVDIRHANDDRNLLGRWFYFDMPADGVHVDWSNVEETSPEIDTFLDRGQTVVLQTAVLIHQRRPVLRTQHIGYVLDPYELAAYMKLYSFTSVKAFVEMSPLDNGRMRLMAGDFQPFKEVKKNGFKENESHWGQFDYSSEDSDGDGNAEIPPVRLLERPQPQQAIQDAESEIEESLEAQNAILAVEIAELEQSAQKINEALQLFVTSRKAESKIEAIVQLQSKLLNPNPQQFVVLPTGNRVEDMLNESSRLSGIVSEHKKNIKKILIFLIKNDIVDTLSTADIIINLSGLNFD